MSVITKCVDAAKFATKENWLPKGFETLGLGKPGLWGFQSLLE